MNIDKLNFKGNYRSHDPNGILIEYVLGDVVFYSGKTYVATKTKTGMIVYKQK